MPRALDTASLQNRLAELELGALCPCDLGDGIEVVHEVEAVEVEMECALDDVPRPLDVGAAIAEALAAEIERELFDEDHTCELEQVEAFTMPFDREGGTHQFVRESAPYERIEVELDASGFRQATIEEARALAGATRLTPRRAGQPATR